jgi:tetratricopeptide (TPR) repeat protein
MGEYSKALSFHEKALAIWQESLHPDHPDLARSYIAHGLAFNQMKKHAEAIRFYQKALDIQQQSLSPYHPDLGMSYNNIGLVYKTIRMHVSFMNMLLKLDKNH